jgi:hypothetical protein
LFFRAEASLDSANWIPSGRACHAPQRDYLSDVRERRSRSSASGAAGTGATNGADAKLTELLMTLANCEKARSFSIYDRCKARFWQKQLGNDGKVRVLVPDGVDIEPRTGRVPDAQGDGRLREKGADPAHFPAAAMVATLEGHVATLKAELERRGVDIQLATGRGPAARSHGRSQAAALVATPDRLKRMARRETGSGTEERRRGRSFVLRHTAAHVLQHNR